MKTQYREKAKKKANKRINIDVNWQVAEQTWGSIPLEEFVDLHLPEARSSMANKMIEQSRTDLTSFASTVLSLPEYQLC
jgi:hypothetical protein